MQLASGKALNGELISLDYGAGNPAPPHNDGSLELVGAKPFGALYRRWQHWREALARDGFFDGTDGADASAAERLLWAVGVSKINIK